MKKIYLTPIMNVECAEPESIICTSIKSDTDTGLTPGGGSNGEAHAPEWDLWGEDE